MPKLNQTLTIATIILGLAMPPEAFAKSSKQQIFLNQAKEYAFASCIYQQYKGDPLSLEADAWASGIIENGNLDINAYSEISELTKKLPATGVTRLGASMKLQACFNYINSSEFEKSVKHVLKK